MTSVQPNPPQRHVSNLDVTFDALIRRVEHAATLRERQGAIDTLFERRRGDTPPHLIVLPQQPTRRNLP
ncbi:MAG TPA: hypothetical protein VHX44_01485 [Planctomycetota bacterium]|nr:hypothetical protein [Planctomycetota bacterium]